ncbi:hypothetical protein DFH09DRAFT_331602 [Mycena vulgaris]|nr:hypothetical protein DFH09DRAFT_331602 [Mycena vulgaris]
MLNIWRGCILPFLVGRLILQSCGLFPCRYVIQRACTREGEYRYQGGAGCGQVRPGAPWSETKRLAPVPRVYTLPRWVLKELCGAAGVCARGARVR